MRKSLQVIGAAAAIAVMIAVPALNSGSEVRTETKAGSDHAAQVKTSTQKLSFEEAIESFYQRSGSLTDDQILASARDILSDGDVLYSELKEDESRDAFEALSEYEEAKAGYLTSAINDTEAAAGDPAVRREWDRQEQYTRMMIAGGSVIREMIPRFQIVSCTKRNDTLELDVDEWMTLGYSSPAEADAINASAYSYTFTLTLECGQNGAWAPSEINGTDINFAWLDEGGGSGNGISGISRSIV